MSDPRITKMARVLVQYSLGLKPGHEFAMGCPPLAHELGLAIYQEAILAGAHVFVMSDLPGAQEIFLQHASDAQLDHVDTIVRFAVEKFDAYLEIVAPYNTRELSGTDPARQSRARRAMFEIGQIMAERTARGEFRWCITLYPTHASAQESDMSLREYQDFVYSACRVDLPDPVAAWKKVGERQDKLVDWLAGKDHVVIKGSNVDLRMSIQGRTFVNCDGKYNFPDGEIFTGPVESSVNGWVRFSYPGIYGGREVEDIELRFEDGKVVREKAAKGQDLLTALLDTDAGSRTLGELGIGTNYGIQRFSKNMLFDEKMGGTIHLAVGRGMPETGSQNQSAIHWDMLCDMAESEIVVDGELFYKNGQFVV
ncbi:MAG: aminopeptidase [Chloroflexi bacterium]|nr:aminopeptidase [Chloroflexota bacterium]MBU1749906.1 aminopeptidase [Chloroflexota bacterium]MBU1879366.1 aminopeptidase [Chloroflexota bacterium]